jgi:hypothetical protein
MSSGEAEYTARYRLICQNVPSVEYLQQYLFWHGQLHAKNALDIQTAAKYTSSSPLLAS